MTDQFIIDLYANNAAKLRKDADELDGPITQEHIVRREIGLAHEAGISAEIKREVADEIDGWAEKVRGRNE